MPMFNQISLFYIVCHVLIQYDIFYIIVVVLCFSCFLSGIYPYYTAIAMCCDYVLFTGGCVQRWAIPYIGRSV